MKISNPRTFANEPLLTAASGVQAVAILPTPSASTDGKTYLLTGTGHLYYGVANGNTHSLSDITPSCSCAAALAALEARVSALEEGATPTTGTLVVNYTGDAPSGAKWSADSGSTWNDFGDSLTLAAGTYTVSYKAVSGYTAPQSQSASVTAGQTTTITANSYAIIQGTLAVNYTGTAPSGAKWSCDGGTTWRDFGTSTTLDPGNYTVSYKSVSGYTAPSSDLATVSAGQTTTITAGSYTVVQQTFSLSVYSTFQPPTGAAWSYDGGSTWLEFGTAVSPTPGTYTITYKPVANYTAPASHSFTAAANDSIVFYKDYTEITYPNAFVVSGLPNNVDLTTAQFNGTYTKTGNVKTYDGVNYPIYYNGVNYLYMSSATAAALSPNDGSSPMMVGRYGIGNVASMSGTGLTGTWTYYSPSTMPTDTYALTVTESSSTTPEAGTFVDPEDEPTTPTDQYLEISGCSTAAMNGKYYFIVGGPTTAPGSNSTPTVALRHENGHYYIEYYYGSHPYWCVQNTRSRSQYNEPNGSPKYTIGGSMNPVSTVFADGLTYGSITTTYVDTTAPVVVNTPYLNLAGSSNDTYNGNYALYSGNATSTNAVWKHPTENYYIRINGATSRWYLCSTASGSGGFIAQLSNDDPPAASSCFSGGLTMNGYTTTYNDGSIPAASGAHLSVFRSSYGFNSNSDYFGDYYLTSGTAGSTSSVWTRWDGAYQIKQSSYWYIYPASSWTSVAQLSGSGEGAPTSWGTAIEYDGYRTTYHAS